MLSVLTSHQLKVYELQYLESQGLSLHTFSALESVPSPFADSPETATNPLLHRLITHNLKSFSGGAGKAFLGYGYLLLSSLYGAGLNESLLLQVKSALYSEELDLLECAPPLLAALSNADMKRFFIEFLFELSFADSPAALDRKLEKYPVILHIFAAFLQCLAERTGAGGEGDCGEALEQLNDCFDINCRRVDSLFLFFEEGLFLYLDERLVFAGAYSEKVRSSKRPSIKQRKNSSSSREASSQDKSNLFETRVRSYHIEDTVRESNYLEIDAPTPFFNLGSEQNQQTIRDSFKICDPDNLLELNNYLSVPNLRALQVIHAEEQEHHEDEPDFSSIGRFQRREREERQRQQKEGEGRGEGGAGRGEEREKKVTSRGKVYTTPNFLKKLSMMKTIDFEDDQSDDGSYLTEEKLLLEMERGGCECHRRKGKKNAICSKLYEINIFNYPHKEAAPTETGLNMLSTRSSLIFSAKDCVAPADPRPRRLPAHTVRTERSSDEKPLNVSYESYFEGYPRVLDNTLNSISDTHCMSPNNCSALLPPFAPRPRVRFHYPTRQP